MMPKSDPEAPVEDWFADAKLPPMTNPKIPALMYTRKKRIDPMARSMSLPIVSCRRRLKPICTKPACIKMGTMKRNHWLGAGSWSMPGGVWYNGLGTLSPKAHSCWSVHVVSVPGLPGHGKGIGCV